MKLWRIRYKNGDAVPNQAFITKEQAQDHLNKYYSTAKCRVEQNLYDSPYEPNLREIFLKLADDMYTACYNNTIDVEGAVGILRECLLLKQRKIKMTTKVEQIMNFARYDARAKKTNQVINNMKTLKEIEKESEAPKDRKPFQMDDELEQAAKEAKQAIEMEEFDKSFPDGSWAFLDKCPELMNDRMKKYIKQHFSIRQTELKQFITDNFVPKSEIIIDEAEEKATDNFYRDYIPKSEVEKIIEWFNFEKKSRNGDFRQQTLDFLQEIKAKLNQLKG